MLKKLYYLYGRAPAPIRSIIVKLSRPLRMLAAPFLRKNRLGGYIQVLNSSDNGALNCFAQKESYEKQHMDLFLSYISCNTDGVVLDVGANYGQYSLAAANIGRYGTVNRILAFEPDSVPYKCLYESIQINGFTSFFSVIQTIIGDSAGMGDLLKSCSSSLSNRTFITKSQALASIGSSVSERCRIASIDELLTENGISTQGRRFFIKVDIEGNEPKAFRGASKLLDKCLGYVIQFEYYPFAMLEASEEPADFRKLLSSLAFDTILLIKESKACVLSREEMFSIMKNLDNAARPTYAENFILVKNCLHPIIVHATNSAAGISS